MRAYLGLIILALAALPAHAMGSKPRGYTLVVLPAKYAVVQFGRDLVDREPVLMMTYEPGAPAEDPFLHAWSGERWIRVPADVYASGGFARIAPSRTVVVGPPNALVAGMIEQAAAWTPQVLNVESAEVADLVNAMGRFFQFDQREWEWFAARYELKLEDLNREVRNQSWYDRNTPGTLPPVQKPFHSKPAPVQVKEAPVSSSLQPITPIPATTVAPTPSPIRASSGDLESFSFSEE